MAYNALSRETREQCLFARACLAYKLFDDYSYAEGEAIQGSEEITEAKELSQPFTDAEEPAFVEETLDSPLDISDSPLDFISLEVDDTGSTKLQTTDPSTTTPEPDDQQQPSVDASEAVDPSNDQQQWYTDAQGNWITAEEYQKQWEVYNQQMEAYQASHGQVSVLPHIHAPDSSPFIVLACRKH